ncbi:sulfurtransferase [Paenibacillus endoradicis]|uniref:sulfurtransferase n=1 Tax=Paenibacillus endoradicis TaxID=2972487 RepID=UPI002159986F|nr:sulfurtransferase [Paenibacillus endoradicis]MCR8657401.1 sulfurtransferase [Paenibacillus endoradicis]
MSYFIRQQRLQQLLEAQAAGDTKLVIVDVRYDLSDEDAGEIAYREGHIPQAHYANLSHDLSSGKRPDGEGGRHPLPDPQAVAQFFGSIGIATDSIVVAYDDQGGAMASRLRWLLQWIGFDGEVYVLEGGFKSWKEAGQAVSTDIPDRLEGFHLPVELNESILVDQQYVHSKIGAAGTVIIDSRDGARYRGEVEPLDKVAGHVPSAVNYFWQEGKNADGSWKNAEEQAERFAAIDKNDEVIVYCGSGVTATPNYFALQEAGYNNVKLYAGSWSDWSSNSDNPVAVGDE